MTHFTLSACVSTDWEKLWNIVAYV